jgi:steroid delta-isomerase
VSIDIESETLLTHAGEPATAGDTQTEPITTEERTTMSGDTTAASDSATRSRDEIVADVEAYLAALGAGDFAAIHAMYGDEPTIEDPIGSPPMVGRKAMEDFYTSNFKVRYVERLGPISVCGNHAGFQFQIEISLGDNSPHTTIITELMRFAADGKIESMVAVPDYAAGAAAARPSSLPTEDGAEV